MVSARGWFESEAERRVWSSTTVFSVEWREENAHFPI